MKVIEDMKKLDCSKIKYRDIFEIINDKNLYEVVVYYNDEIILVKNLTIDDLLNLINQGGNKDGTKENK